VEPVFGADFAASRAIGEIQHQRNETENDEGQHNEPPPLFTAAGGGNRVMNELLRHGLLRFQIESAFRDDRQVFLVIIQIGLQRINILERIRIKRLGNILHGSGIGQTA